MIKNANKFQYPKNYAGTKASRFPNNTVVYIALESQQNCVVAVQVEDLDKDENSMDEEGEQTVKQILCLPNVKITERLKKLDNKI